MVFQGKYQKGQRHGSGIIFEEGKEFHLSFVRGRIEGPAKIFKHKVVYYVGDVMLEDDGIKPHGFGREFDRLGRVLYDGRWCRGNYDGRGRFADYDQKIWGCATFSDGLLHGPGKMYMSHSLGNGTFLSEGAEPHVDELIFSGVYERGMRKAGFNIHPTKVHFGVLRTNGLVGFGASFHRVVGEPEWNVGLDTGFDFYAVLKGLIDSGRCLQYLGEWSEGAWKQGSLFDRSGSLLYQGEFKGTMYHGEGVLHEMGGRFVGQFRNGMKDGEGAAFDAKGNKVSNGRWSENSFLGPCPTRKRLREQLESFYVEHREELPEIPQCALCLDHLHHGDVSYVYIACGHRAMCKDCQLSTQLKKTKWETTCPLCKKQSSLLRVY